MEESERGESLLGLLQWERTIGAGSANTCPWLSDGEGVCRVSVRWLTGGEGWYLEPVREVFPQARMAAELKRSRARARCGCSSPRGGKEGGCGETLRRPLSWSTMATQIHIRPAVPVVWSSAQWDRKEMRTWSLCHPKHKGFCILSILLCLSFFICHAFFHLSSENIFIKAETLLSK